MDNLTKKRLEAGAATASEVLADFKKVLDKHKASPEVALNASLWMLSEVATGIGGSMLLEKLPKMLEANLLLNVADIERARSAQPKPH